MTWSIIIAMAAAGGVILWLGLLGRRIWHNLALESDRRSYEAELRTGQFWRRYGERAYRRQLEAALNWLHRRVGLGWLEPRGFGVCVAFAFGYNALLFVGGWVAGVDLHPSPGETDPPGAGLQGVFGSVAGLDILPRIDGELRGAFGVVIGLSVIPLVVSVLRTRDLPRGRAIRRLIAPVAIALLLAAAGHRLAIGRWLPNLTDHYSMGIVLMIGAIQSSALLLALFLSGRPGWAAGIMVLALIAVLGILPGIDITRRDRVTVLFLGLLPTINGVVDWVSWMVSLKLGRVLIARELTPKRIMAHAGLDLAAALALTFVLTCALTAGLTVGAAGVSPIEIADEVVRAPWGHGAWIVLMLLSTLLPTALHALMLLGAALVCQFPAAWRTSRANELASGHPEGRSRDALAFFLTVRWLLPPVGFIALGAALLLPAYQSASVVGRGLVHAAWVVAEWTDNPRAEVAELEVKVMRCAQAQSTLRSSEVPADRRAAHRRAGRDAWDRIRDMALDDPHLFVTAGVCLYDGGAAEHALAAIDRALVLRPDDASFHDFRGTILQRLGRDEEALSSGEKAMALAPDEANFYINHGVTLLLAGQYEAAREVLDRALELDSGNERARLLRFKALIAAQQARAMQIAADRRAAIVHHRRSRTLRAKKRHAEALAADDLALALDPGNAQYHHDRGRTLHLLGRYEDALAAKDQAVRLEPRKAGYHLSRGLTLAALRRTEEALSAVVDATELEPGNAENHYTRGKYLLLLKRDGEALTALDRAAELKPAVPKHHRVRSSALLALGRPFEALEALDLAARLEPDNRSHRRLRAHILRRATPLNLPSTTPLLYAP